MDHYEVLGVARTASADEIKLAYKRAAKRWHPDKARFWVTDPAIDATAKFQEVAAAYAVLGDPEKRAEYDGTSHAPGLLSQASVDAMAAQPAQAGPCPICKGAGSVRTPDLSENGRILFWSNKACPRGCKAPAAKR